MKIDLSNVSRRPAWPPAVAVLVGLWAVMGLAVIALAERTGRDVTLCSFKRVTGLPCPTCGFTRGMIRMAHGDVAGALAMNPLLFSFLLAAAATVVLRVGFGRKVVFRFSPRARLAAWALAVAALLANWAYVVMFVH